MTQTTRNQAAALVLAVFATVGMLTSMDRLATPDQVGAAAANWEAPIASQVVVIEAKRLTRG